MNPIITIFCEGNSKSLDYRVLEKVYGDTPPRTVSSGSKNSLSAFMDGYGTSQRVVEKGHFLAFRDRDFDYEVPDTESLIKDGKFLVSYKTTIENYLLNPRILFEYIWYSGLPSQRRSISTIAQVEEIFRTSANNLRFYTAARWAHGNVKKQNTEVFRPKSDWPYRSGDLPEDVSDSGCRIIMADIIGNIKGKAEQLPFDVFESSYARFVTKFDSTFLSNFDNFICWFNGKDIARAIFSLLPPANSFFRNGEKGDYYDFALERLGTEDFPLPPDLIELRNILNGTSSL